MPDDVELVEGNAGIRQVRGYALDEGGRHVDAHRADGLGGTAAGRELAGQCGDGLGTAALGHCQYAALYRVGGQRDVVMPAGAGGFVDGDVAHRGEIGLRERQLDGAFADRGHPVPALAYQPRRGGEGHLLAQHQHQRLEQQGEARELPRPRRLDLPYRAVWQSHPREADLQEALVLEEVQMPIAFRHRIVDWMLAGHARCHKAAAHGKVDANREHACLSIEVCAGHIPRCGNLQGGRKQFFGYSYQVGVG